MPNSSLLEPGPIWQDGNYVHPPMIRPQTRETSCVVAKALTEEPEQVPVKNAKNKKQGGVC